VSALSDKLRNTQKAPVSSQESESRSEKRTTSATTLPSLIVLVQDRSGTLDLQHAPQQANHLLVNFSDGTKEEVPAKHCQIQQIIFP